MQASRPAHAALVALAAVLTPSVVLLTGFDIALGSQVSSPDYHALFRKVTLVAVVHFPLGILYFSLVRHGWRWFVAAVMALTALSYGEFALRML